MDNTGPGQRVRTEKEQQDLEFLYSVRRRDAIGQLRRNHRGSNVIRSDEELGKEYDSKIDKQRNKETPDQKYRREEKDLAIIAKKRADDARQAWARKHPDKASTAEGIKRFEDDYAQKVASGKLDNLRTRKHRRKTKAPEPYSRPTPVKEQPAAQWPPYPPQAHTVWAGQGIQYPAAPSTSGQQLLESEYTPPVNPYDPPPWAVQQPPESEYTPPVNPYDPPPWAVQQRSANPPPWAVQQQSLQGPSANPQPWIQPQPQLRLQYPSPQPTHPGIPTHYQHQHGGYTDNGHSAALGRGVEPDSNTLARRAAMEARLRRSRPQGNQPTQGRDWEGR